MSTQTTERWPQTASSEAPYRLPVEAGNSHLPNSVWPNYSPEDVLSSPHAYVTDVAVCFTQALTGEPVGRGTTVYACVPVVAPDELFSPFKVWLKPGQDGAVICAGIEADISGRVGASPVIFLAGPNELEVSYRAWREGRWSEPRRTSGAERERLLTELLVQAEAAYNQARAAGPEAVRRHTYSMLRGRVEPLGTLALAR